MQRLGPLPRFDVLLELVSVRAQAHVMIVLVLHLTHAPGRSAATPRMPPNLVSQGTGERSVGWYST